MKKILMVLMATLLGLVVALPSPAYAEDGENGPDLGDFVALLRSVYEKGADGRYDLFELQDLYQDVTAAITGTKDDLLAKLSSRVEAQIVSQIQAAVTMAPAMRIGGQVKANAITSIHNAAYLVRGQIADGGYGEAQVDTLARAEITLFTTLIAGYQSYGTSGTFAANVQKTEFRNGLNVILAKTQARCHEFFNRHIGVIESYTCSYGNVTVRAVYNLGTQTHSIDGGPPIGGLILGATTRAVEDRVIQTTVRAQAQAALDELNRQQPQ